MTPTDLGFTPAWAAVLPPELIADVARLADPGRPPRFWRWLAVREFVAEREPLGAADCRALFGLGSGEPDLNLGAAIACTVLCRRACPEDVRAAARVCSRGAVRRAAGQPAFAPPSGHT